MINVEEMVLQTNPEVPPSPFRLGVVAALFANNTAQVLFDGETTASEKQYAYLSPYIPEADDRVLLVSVGGTYIIMGDISFNVAPSPPEVPQNYLFDSQEVVMTQGLDVTGLLEAKSGVTVTGNVTATGALTGGSLSTGSATLTGNLSAVDVSATGNLAVTGTSILSGATTISGTTTINAALSARGVSTGSGYSSNFAGGMTVGGNVNLSSGGNLTCNKSASFTATTILPGSANFSTTSTSLKTVSVTGTLAVAEKATFSKEIQINGELNHDGTAVGFFGATPTTQRSGTLYQKLSAGASLTDVINKVNAYIQVLDDLGFVNI